MRRMSFSMTTDQIRRQEKTVTRRIGWTDLRQGDRFVGIEKGQGLKKGEKQIVIAPLLECISNMRLMIYEIDQGDCIREGFPDLTPDKFIAMFCKANRVKPTDVCQRIEFKYVDAEATPS